MSEPISRSEINEKYKWSLEDMFPSDLAWESAVSEVMEKSREFSQYKGRVTESAEILLQSLRCIDEIGELLLSVVAYANMRSDEDNTLSKYRAMSDRAGDIASEAQTECSFFEPELISAGKEKIYSYLNTFEELGTYRQFFDNLFREAEHILDEKSERLLAMSSSVGSAASDIFSAMNDADMQFGKIKTSDGREEELTHSRYGTFLESEDREVRRSAYELMYAQYKKYKNTFASMYSGSVKSDLFYAKARGFSSSLSMKLSDSAVPEKVYNGLCEDVNSGLGALSEYLKLRKKLLGVSRLCMYDLYTSLVPTDNEKISYEKACEMVLDAVLPLGGAYVNDMRRAFSERWVDVYENKGKTSGAYSWGDNKNHPFVLMNYQGTIEDVFTLAHEMGHAMHSYYTNRTQPSVYKDYKIFVAEVASTVNENLLLEYLMKGASGERRAYLLGRKLEAIRTTFYRQTMFAEFEKCVHEKYMNGIPLTAEELCKNYGDINKKYYGSVAVCDDEISYEWARIPHFYTSFYVYQYATGFAAATQIKELVKENRSNAEKYLGFLKSGSSDYPLNLLKKTGVDLGDSHAASCVISEMKSATDELGRLLDK